jgi:hypothetical protein
MGRTIETFGRLTSGPGDAKVRKGLIRAARSQAIVLVGDQLKLRLEDLIILSSTSSTNRTCTRLNRVILSWYPRLD